MVVHRFFEVCVEKHNELDDAIVAGIEANEVDIFAALIPNSSRQELFRKKFVILKSHFAVCSVVNTYLP